MKASLIRQLLLIAASVLICESYFLTINTLENNHSWRSQKVSLTKGVLGSVSNIITRPALDRERLHLGTWGGFQEYWWTKEEKKTSLTFEFKLTPTSYFYLQYGSDRNKLNALRVSNNTALTSHLFQVNRNGTFDTPRKMPFDINDNTWHKLTVSFGEGADVITLDDGTPQKVSHRREMPTLLGFRGGYYDVEIDNVDIISGAGRSFENFNYHGDRLSVYCVVFLVTVSFVYLLSALLFRSFLTLRRTCLTIISISLFCCSIVLYVYEDRYVGYLYPTVIDLKNYSSKIETEQQTVDRFRLEHIVPGAPSPTRVFFLGSSQVWGAGTMSAQETFVARIEQALRDECDPKYEVLNGGISGLRLKKILAWYETFFYQYLPTTVILSTGLNDERTSSEDFQTDLEQLIKFNKERGIQTIFVPEPISGEMFIGGAFARQNDFREVAARYKIPLIEVQEELARSIDTGFLWWDIVHLTTHGNLQYEAIALPQLRRVLCGD